VLIDYVIDYAYSSRMHFTGWSHHNTATASHIVTSQQSVVQLFQVDFKSPVSHIFHQSVAFLYVTESGA